MSPTLAEVESLARQAGEILRGGFVKRPGYERTLKIEYKGPIDLVTEMDHRSEAFLLGEIRQRYPDHRIISEESGRLAGSECCQWFVDPLDGTVNYAHSIPIYSVSIAYAEEGVVRLGCVYDPMQDECFTAEGGKGAWLNGEPIRVSRENRLDLSLLVTGFPYDIRTNPQNNLDHFVYFSLQSQAVRRLGSAALDLCYVATGRFEGFWETSIHTWDVAAGGLVAAEAGALVTRLDGSPDYLVQPTDILAANPALHAQILSGLHRQ